ncbi:MAG TPA: hypothetical protein VF141_11790 [Chryseolinea sp.]
MGPSIILFTGHLLDKIDRTSARFPYRLIREVKTLIEIEVEQIMKKGVPLMAVSSLAAGGDMLFASEMVRRHVPLSVFLPFEKERFLADSVRYLKDLPSEDPKEWEDHFHENMSKASQVIVTHSNGLSPEEAYSACNQAMLAFALNLTKNLPSKIMALALIQNTTEIKKGGAADFVNQLESTGINVKKIWPGRTNKLYC